MHTSIVPMTRVVHILNSKGLHARPSGMLTSLVSNFSSTVTVLQKGQIFNVKSIMETMEICGLCGEDIEFSAIGEDAGHCLDAIECLVNTAFFRIDCHDTLRQYSRRTKDRSAKGLAAAAFSNNDLKYWYTKTEPTATPERIANELSRWITFEGFKEDQMPPLPPKAELDENLSLFTQIVVSHLKEILR